MKCPRCNNEFADGLQNCPYCGCEITKKDSVNGEFSVPKFTASYKMANPRVKNQKEAIKKINEVNRIPKPNDDGADKTEPAAKKQPEETISLKKDVTATEQVDKSTTTATAVVASENAPADNKPLTREDLIAMQKKADERVAERDKMEEDLHEDADDEIIEKEDEENDEENTENVKFSKRGLFGRKKRTQREMTRKGKEESPEFSESDLEDDEDKYDVNVDGYYDDLIPELAHQINKIPQENIIKVVFIVIFIIILCFIILYTSQ